MMMERDEEGCLSCSTVSASLAQARATKGSLDKERNPVHRQPHTQAVQVTAESKQGKSDRCVPQLPSNHLSRPTHTGEVPAPGARSVMQKGEGGRC